MTTHDQPVREGTGDRAARRRAAQRLFGIFREWLPLVLTVPALVVAAQLLRIVATRLTFPVDLEWIEGGQLLHAYRVLRGEELFTEPNVGFMPYSYPPGHTVVLTVFGAIFGVDYWVGRLVSCLAFAIIVGILSAHAAASFSARPLRIAAAITAVGIIAAAFPLTGGWFDLIRNDELALGLSLAAAALAFDRGPMSRRRFITTLLVMNAAVFTKQTAVFYLTWVLLFHFVRNPRQGFKLGVGLLLLGAATTGFLEWVTHGRYLDYTVFLLSKQVVHKHMYQDALNRWLDFAPFLPALPAVAVILALYGLLNARALYWLGLLGAAFPASMLPYAKQGGYINNLLPVAVISGPVALMLVGSLVSKSPRRAAAPVGALALFVFAAGSAYLSRRNIPPSFAVTPARRAAAERLIESVKALGPSVWSPHHPFVAIKAGSKVEQVHEMPWVDAWLAGVQGLNLKPWVERTRPEHILLTGREIPLLMEAIADNYHMVRRLSEAELVPPITGFPTYPQYVLARSEKKPKQDCLFEFESAPGDDWGRTGRAFRSGVRSRSKHGRAIVGRRGYVLTSGGGGDDETGTLLSPEFSVEKPKLSAFVGGGESKKLALRVRVNDEVVGEVRGGNHELLELLTFDLRDYIGQFARLEIVDEDPHGHILVDHVCWN